MDQHGGSGAHRFTMALVGGWLAIEAESLAHSTCAGRLPGVPSARWVAEDVAASIVRWQARDIALSNERRVIPDLERAASRQCGEAARPPRLLSEQGDLDAVE